MPNGWAQLGPWLAWIMACAVGSYGTSAWLKKCETTPMKVTSAMKASPSTAPRFLSSLRNALSRPLTRGAVGIASISATAGSCVAAPPK